MGNYLGLYHYHSSGVTLKLHPSCTTYYRCYNKKCKNYDELPHSTSYAHINVSGCNYNCKCHEKYNNDNTIEKDLVGV